MCLNVHAISPHSALDLIQKAEIGEEIEFSLWDTWKRVTKSMWQQKNICDGSYTSEYSDQRTHEEMINHFLEKITPSK